MCGRFVQYLSAQRYAGLFGINTRLSQKARYNITPGTDVLACRFLVEGNKELVPLLPDSSAYAGYP